MVSDTKAPRDLGKASELTPSSGASPGKLSPRGVRAIQGREVSRTGGQSPGVGDGAALPSLRQKAVRDAWTQERQLVRASGQGTRDWTSRQMKQLRDEGKVPGYEGHHIRSVNQHTTKWAGDPRNITFVTRQQHLNLHGRDFHNPTTGNLIDRPAMIRMAEANRQSVRPRVQ